MDFEISDRMKTILEMINEFVEKELIPLEPEFVNHDFKEMVPVLAEKRQMVKPYHHLLIGRERVFSAPGKFYGSYPYRYFDTPNSLLTSSWFTARIFLAAFYVYVLVIKLPGWDGL